MRPDILFEDEHLVAIDKPSGLLSIPDRFDQDIPSLSKILESRYGEIFVVHRLDRETSGAIIFAKTAETHRLLNIQFESRRTSKKYIAVVEGRVSKDHDTISLPIAPHHKRQGQMRVDEKNGKEALTEYTVLERYGHSTKVEITLHTGRQHQIRVHFAAIGHPLLVDRMYGNREEYFLSAVKRNYKAVGAEKPLIGRLTLHASEISLTHPIKQLPLRIVAPLPKDIASLCKQLGKWDKEG
ncbi:MAG TPA: RluA family pseudouridine synthase [Candidatus Kapabacteria bacterium]|nr:RluA family pseudouridine synthase [Candidatus Kapabacteria bacterium]